MRHLEGGREGCGVSKPAPAFTTNTHTLLQLMAEYWMFSICRLRSLRFALRSLVLCDHELVAALVGALSECTPRSACTWTLTLRVIDNTLGCKKRHPGVHTLKDIYIMSEYMQDTCIMSEHCKQQT